MKLPSIARLGALLRDNGKERAAIKAILTGKSVVWNVKIEDGKLDIDGMKKGSVIFNTTIIHTKIIAAGDVNELFPSWLTNPSLN